MKPKEKADRTGLISLRLLVAIVIFLGAQPLLFAASNTAYPGWWTSQGVINGNPPNDYAAVNQGQAKTMVVAAVRELDIDLWQFGGAGSELDQLASTLITGTSPQSNDYVALNIGQLKWLSRPFYDRLLSLGYNGPPLTSGTYPWITSGKAAQDFSVGNIGQLKFLFSFDVIACSGSNGTNNIPDWWSNKYFPGQIIDSGSAVGWSGGQVTILQAYQKGLNPIDFYNGQPPFLTIVSGASQTGSEGGFLPAPLVVRVTGTGGSPLYDAPVTFTITSGGGMVQKSNLRSPCVTLTVLADSSGYAQAFFQLPALVSNTSQITAAAGQATPVTFNEFSDNGNTGITYRSPFVPSNVLGTVNADGSEDMTWQNNTDPSDTTPIPVWHWNSTTQSWFQIDSVPAGTTSYHVRPNPTPMQ